MDLETELEYNQKEWNELRNYFDQTEQRILDNIRTGDKECAKKNFDNLQEIENRMRPIRNNLIYIYENLVLFSSDTKKYNQEFIKDKAKHLFENKYKRNESSLNLIGILSRNGIDVSKQYNQVQTLQ